MHEREQYHQPEASSETARLIRAYADLFVQRRDTYARQRDHSRSYYRVLDTAGRPVPLTDAEIRRHLRGEITLGLYSVDVAGLTKWVAIDADESILSLLAAKQRMALMGIPSYLEASRRGGHL